MSRGEGKEKEGEQGWDEGRERGRGREGRVRVR